MWLCHTRRRCSKWARSSTAFSLVSSSNYEASWYVSSICMVMYSTTHSQWWWCCCSCCVDRWIEWVSDRTIVNSRAIAGSKSTIWIVVEVCQCDTFGHITDYVSWIVTCCVWVIDWIAVCCWMGALNGTISTAIGLFDKSHSSVWYMHSRLLYVWRCFRVAEDCSEMTWLDRYQLRLDCITAFRQLWVVRLIACYVVWWWCCCVLQRALQ